MTTELELTEEVESEKDHSAVWRKTRAIEEWTNRPRATNEEIQKLTGASVRTLQRWKRDPEFVADLLRATRSTLFAASPQLYEVALKKALDGDWKFMKICLDHIERIEQQQLELMKENTFVIQWKSDNMITIEPKEISYAE